MWLRWIMRWITGAVLGTALVAITSPWFVRTYALRQPSRHGAPDESGLRSAGVDVLPPGTAFRWRSEGYATTSIGPYGMPGKSNIDLNARRSVALWGDSQAEGLAVPDSKKIFAIAESIGGPSWQVYPLAQSGDDATAWLKQIRWAENVLGVDQHVFLIVELSDLTSVLEPAANPAQPRFESVAPLTPAFVIQSARNLIGSPDGQRLRSLRFSIGPVSRHPVSRHPVSRHQEASTTKQGHPSCSTTHSTEDRDDWAAVVRAMTSATRQPILFVYAPKVPEIAGGKRRTFDPDEQRFAALKQACLESGVTVADLSEDFRRAAALGKYPHGFHNGVIGAGHLNSVGNRIIARSIVVAIVSAIEPDGPRADWD